MSVINNSPLMLGEDGYQISRSVRLRSSASAYFNRTPASAGNQTTWTWSGWVKRGTLGSTQRLLTVGSAATDAFGFTSSDTFQFFTDSTGQNLITSQVFRDPSAWYHIIVVNDTTQSTASNRVKLYLNGSQITALGTATYPAQNSTGTINSANAHNIGRRLQTASEYFDGYLTEVNFVDGQALTPSSFGETDAVTGVWKPKKYAGTYGTNGFYLNFSDPSAATAAAIGKDYSGNGNNWTPNNINLTSGSNTYDSMIDVPTPYADGGNGRGNYAVLNPLANVNLTPSYLWGNLNAQLNAGSNGWTRMFSSMGVSTGKWYVECEFGTDTGAGEWSYLGIKSSSGNTALSTALGASADEWVFVDSGFRRNNNSSVSYGNAQGQTFNLRMAVDLDNGRIWWGDASGWFASGDPAAGTNAAYTGLSGEFYVLFGLYRSTGTSQNVLPNFGQRPFAYTPPTGFKALNTQNLPDSAVKKGNKHFDVSKWTGNGGTQSITGLAFQPDLVWSKDRSAANFHALYDSVRGATKVIQSNTTTAEQTFATGLTSFNTDGFTTGSNSDTNTNGNSYVGWQWKAGGTAVSNTAGSITSQVSANTTAGFSVVTYTGTGANATVGHGLGVAPKFVIIKNRDYAQNWPVWFTGLAGSEFLTLNTTNGKNTDTTLFNSTAPTSTVFNIGTANQVNFSTAKYVAYCFSEVAGFSKFGRYTGNGSADGPFVFCGFRPKFVMVKRTNDVSSWYINDAERSPDNDTTGEDLYPNLSNAEGGTVPIDILSNGFKIRTSNNSRNQSGGTYIYAAFAETDFAHALAR